MSTIGDVQMNLPLVNMDCVEQVVSQKVLAGKEQNLNNSDMADNESHSGKIPCELFCVTGKDLDLIDIDDLY